MVFVLFISIFSVFLPAGICKGEEGKIFIVQTDGDSNYTRIQDAIDVANPGDTIYVRPGVYYENLVVNKTISLVGEDKNTTIINGNNSGYYTILIQDSGVNISGFTIQNSTVGVYVGGNKSINNTMIRNNIINNNKDGIFLGNLSNNNVISKNIITNNSGEGIRLFRSFNNFIYENNITNQENFAIVLWDSSCSNVISQNTILNNKKGIGLKRWSDNNLIFNNTILEDGSGISFSYSYKNIISGNSISNNSKGIYLGDSSENVISANIICDNYCGIYLYDSINNTIDSDNIFSGNNQDISEGSKTFKTPGFELFFVICSMLFVFLGKKRR
jgi:parallel beta-helix repeat protein